ncbi:MAG: corrinoid protein [Candidatus Bathyarchaeia archaeon]
MALSEEKVFEGLKKAVIECDEETAKKIAEEVLKKGIDPLEAIRQGLMEGMKVVGEKMAKSEVFITEVMMAAEAMKAAIEILKPQLSEKRISEITIGKVVLGTVYGDIHDIGKNIVATMLEAAGFEVFDIGCDVPTPKFIEKAEEVKADIIGASALLTVTKLEQEKIIKLLKELGLRDKYKVIVGGAIVTQEWANEIGADGYGKDAEEAVRVAKDLVGAK